LIVEQSEVSITVGLILRGAVVDVISDMREKVNRLMPYTSCLEILAYFGI
jgi:hypothetical protein